MICGIAISTWAAEPPHPQGTNAVFVPDQATAIAIAEAILTPIYGATKVKNERPYKAKITNGVWTVRGTMYVPFYMLPFKKYRKGGAAVARISEKSGEIIEAYHEK